MMNFAQIRNGVVENIAVFESTPEHNFAGFDFHIHVPENMPVSIGHTWDGESFYDVEGNKIKLRDDNP